MSLQVSLLIPARNSEHSLEATVTEAYRYLEAQFPGQYEIILIPNPAPGNVHDRSPQVARELAAKFSTLQVVDHPLPPTPQGKGAALRTGFMASRGRWIFFTDADLPYDLSFFTEAAQKLRAGFDLVTGNRRLATSQFDVPVELLRLAYGRHRLGLFFNRVVRWLLPIHTTDTQSGIKALSRRLAQAAFEAQECPGFFFDLELFLTAAGKGYRQVELPVTLFLNSEKSTVRVFRESLLAMVWLTRITWRQIRGGFGRVPRPAVLRRYSSRLGGDFGTRLFLRLRWALTPYSTMAARLPHEGALLDVGSGHGLLSLTLALSSPERQVLGVDHDEKRVALAKKASEGLENLSFVQGQLLPLPALPRGRQKFSGISIIDVMHYFEPRIQEQLIQAAFDALGDGGTLIVREVDPDGGVISHWNRLYERLATRIGFTQSTDENLHFRSEKEWLKALAGPGFHVASERCSSRWFADILYVCQKE